MFNKHCLCPYYIGLLDCYKSQWRWVNPITSFAFNQMHSKKKSKELMSELDEIVSKLLAACSNASAFHLGRWSQKSWHQLVIVCRHMSIVLCSVPFCAVGPAPAGTSRRNLLRWGLHESCLTWLGWSPVVFFKLLCLTTIKMTIIN